MPPLSQFKTWVFDCDGVLLDSNKVKTEAFYRAAERYGEAHARALVDYHVRNGGISRYVKFQLFLSEIVGQVTPDPGELQQLLDRYAGYVGDGLRQCRVASGLADLRELTPHTRWLVVSGGDQQELQGVFEDRGLSRYFDAGIFGSPDTKDDILVRESETGLITKPAVFVGDSQYDIEAARRAGLEFIFLREWSESSYHFDDALLRLDSIQSLVGVFE